MENDNYIWIKSVVTSVNGRADYSTLLGRSKSELEIEIEDNDSRVKKVKCVGLFPIEKGDMLRLGFADSVYIGCFPFDGHVSKSRTKTDLGACENVDVIEKLRDGRVVATYRNYHH